MSLDFSQVVMAAAAPSQEPNPIVTILMFGGLFVFMYLLIIRPQRKRQKEHTELTKTLSKGDEVIMNSGMLGKITKLDDDYLVLLAGNNVELKFQRAAVHAVLPKGTIKEI
ncbi:preprotein translocase subunit YajC [Porticoccus sp.]